jgi:hypothetical protein
MHAFYAEIIYMMMAIEIVNLKCWPLLWVETDSIIVILAFKNATMVPWQLCNRWLNCVELIKMSFIISHIYRESNQCADGIVNLGLHIPRSQWWDTIPFVNLVCSSAHFFPSSGFFLWVLQVRFLMRQLYISQALTWILV